MTQQPEIASLADFARLARFKRSYVTQLKGDGRLVMTEDGKQVHVAESLALIAATRDPAKAGVVARHAAARATGAGAGAAPVPPAAPAPAQGDPDGDDEEAEGYQYWRKRNERAKALAAERDNRVAAGELLEAKEVVAAVSTAVTTLRRRLETLPAVLGPQLAAVDDEAQARAMVAEAIEHALEETSRQFYALAKEEAVA